MILCADVHNYQRGRLQIGDVTITQIICGTGGADPDFVKDKVPLPSWITPLNVVEVLSPPLVKVLLPAVLVETVPAPARDPIVSLAFTL